MDKKFYFELLLISNKHTTMGGITKILNRYDCKILVKEAWGDKLLAYPVRKHNTKYNKGFYYFYRFEMTNDESIHNIQDEITNKSDVLKHIIVHLSEEDIY